MYPCISLYTDLPTHRLSSCPSIHLHSSVWPKPFLLLPAASPKCEGNSKCTARVSVKVKSHFSPNNNQTLPAAGAAESAPFSAMSCSHRFSFKPNFHSQHIGPVCQQKVVTDQAPMPVRALFTLRVAGGHGEGLSQFGCWSFSSHFWRRYCTFMASLSDFFGRIQSLRDSVKVSKTCCYVTFDDHFSHLISVPLHPAFKVLAQ